MEAINAGHSPVIEPGMDELVCDGVRSGSLAATQDAAAAVASSDVVLLCVGTPSDVNGNLNYAALDRVFSEIAHALAVTEGYKVIALRSTVLPGALTNRLLPFLAHKSGKQPGRDFGAATNPEFLRESSAVDDFRSPPFTLIGQIDARAGDVSGRTLCSYIGFRDPDGPRYGLYGQIR